MRARSKNSARLRRKPVTPGDHWAQRRAYLGLSEREVERACAEIAATLGQQFRVSDSLIQRIESKSILPSAARLYSLCRIYGVSPMEVFSWYGIPFRTLIQERFARSAESTTLVHFDVTELDPVQFSLTPSDGDAAPPTGVIADLAEQWGSSLFSFMTYFVEQRYLFAKLGRHDLFLYPLVTPDTLLVIDPKRTDISSHQTGGFWRRPIYFLELPDEYACGYCEVLSEGRLLLSPHPDSPAKARELSLATQVKVLGRVTSVAIPYLGRQVEAP